MMMGQVPGYELRIKSVLYSLTYKDEIRDLESKINQFFDVFDFFRSNKVFLEWLEIILAHGNYLNGTGSKYFKI